MAYATATRVRDFMGAFGRPKSSETMLQDTFSNLNNWTSKVGSWTASSNEALVSAGASTIALLQADNTYTSTGTYVVNLATSTRAGIYFGATTSASNYQAALIDVPSNMIRVYTTSTGTVTTSSINFTGTLLASTFYKLRVEHTGQTVTILLDGVKQTDASALDFTTGIVGLLAQDNTAVARFSNFQANIDTHFFTDAQITTAIAVGDAMFERRTQFKFSTNLASNELYDWFDQERQQMPYVLSRSFNTLPTFYRLQGFGDANNTLKLRHYPVYSTVKLEENEASDGSSNNWKTRTEGRADDYVVYTDTGTIVFVDNFPRNGHQNLRLTYSYGATTIAEDVAQLSTRYAIREILVGYGAGVDGLENLKRDNEMQIKWMETYFPEATLMACVSKSTSRVT